MSPPTQSDLSSAQLRGLIAVVVVGFLSAGSAFVLLLCILCRIRTKRRRGQFKILPITIFYLCLLFWDTIQGVSWIVNIQWIQHRQIVTGNFCVAQAIIQQLSSTGTALSIVAMSCCILHDHVIDSKSRGVHRPWTGVMALGIISLVQVIDIALPNRLLDGAHSYYGISGYWCWISDEHFTTKIVTEYLWFWMACLFSLFTAMAYCFSVHNQTLLPAGFLWIGFPIRGDKLLRVGLVTLLRRTIRVMLPVPVQYCEMEWVNKPANANGNGALKLLWFPLSYLVLIAPLSILRFIEFRKHSVGFAAVISAGCVFAFTGLVDVVLFCWARPAFGL